MSKLSEKLVELRGNKTQQEIADAIGVSVSAIGMYEIGERIPKDAIKVKLAKFYDVGIEQIFFAEDVTLSVDDSESEE